MVWSGARTSTSQCADGVQNNGEEGLDCGGLCAACDADENSAITVQFPVAVLGLRSLDRAVVLGTIRNTDEAMAGEAEYRATLFDIRDKVLQTIPGQISVPPGEEARLFISAVTVPFSEIARADIELEAAQLKQETIPRKGSVVFSGSPDVSVVENERITIAGTVENRNPVSVETIEILAVLMDGSGNELFAARTLVSRVESFGTRDFVIAVPYDNDIAARMDRGATRLFVLKP